MRRLRFGERAQGIVEFAVIFPLFAALIFVVVDGGLALGRYNNINNSAKEAARLGAVSADKTEIIARAKDQAHGGIDSASVNCATFNSYDGHVICVQWIGGPDGESPGTVGSSIRVRVKFKYSLLTPLPSLVNSVNHIDMTVCAVQRLERSISPVPAGSSVPGETSC